MPLDFGTRGEPTLASEMREFFGPDGGRWCKYALEKDGKCCLLGAAAKLAGRHQQGEYFYDRMATAISLVDERSGDPQRISVARWNNSRRSFSEIATMLDAMDALERAERAPLEPGPIKPGTVEQEEVISSTISSTMILET